MAKKQKPDEGGELVAVALPTLDTPLEPRNLDALVRGAADNVLTSLAAFTNMQALTERFFASFVEIIQRQEAFLKKYRPSQHKEYRDEAHATMTLLTNHMEKQSRAASNIAKVIADLSRLRILLDGGQEVQELGDLSIAELGRIVVNTAQGLEGSKGK